MKTRWHALVLGALLLATSTARASADTLAPQMQSRVVRLAELHIDPSRLEGMVKSLVLVETDPIVLGAKTK